MQHKNYWKVYSLDKEECEWLLDWIVFIQEKIDWSNLSIWMNWDDLFVWSRTQTVWTDKVKNWFRWAVEYINSHEKIRQLILDLREDYNTDDVRLYWEWLVPHTITDYDKEAYNHFYLFDIEINWVRMSTMSIHQIVSINYETIKKPHIFAILENPTIEKIQEFVWQTTIWKRWEWVVVKRLDFINKFWNFVYWKLVSSEFKEEHKLVSSSTSKIDNELDILARYLWIERVTKIMNKIEQNDDVNIWKQHISKILWMTWYDLITEEANSISKYWLVDFKRLKRLCDGKVRIIILNYFNWWETSVLCTK